MSPGIERGSAVVAFRGKADGPCDERPWDAVDPECLSCAVPWRSFRWRDGQKHYSGTYWSATNRDHVIYESRLELARLLLADFDLSVKRIVAQPFLMRAKVDSRVRRHIPDFLLLTDDGPIVVDVKPMHRLADQRTRFTFAWTRALVEACGWRYEVWSGASTSELRNVRFLSGYRRREHFQFALLETLTAGELDGVPFASACRPRNGWPSPVVRAAVLHLLWVRYFDFDLTEPLRPTTALAIRVPA